MRSAHYIQMTVAAAGIVFLLIGCSSQISLEEAYSKTERLFLKELQRDDVHNAFLKVYAPTKPIDWNFTGGEFSNGEKVASENPFYTASIGKTFTATAIGILAEEGKLQFDSKISNYLPNSIMENLHVYEGIDYSYEITIAQLLQHTSGLPDYFEGFTKDGSPNMMELIFKESDKFWRPVETIRFAKEKMTPLFAPGASYNYTDTEYVLLGLIIEKVSGISLSKFFIDHFFEPLGMKHTYLYKRSKPLESTGDLAELYVDDYDASAMTSLTADWAGGGLVSTSGDLIKFQYALFSGNIISAETLNLMQNWVPESRGMEYGFGLRRIDFKKLFPILPNLNIIGHSGSTGSFMFYCPELDIYLSGTLNQTNEIKNSVILMVKVLALIKRAQN